ncbi:hypothetical protein BGX28_004421 [Mortierella sp. GBA30]|nr:hypothetical protein BGX28_004421 [Mortierella sp. GBA30]
MAPAVPPEVIYDVNNIHTALSLTVPDQEALVNVIGRREYQQLLTIARQYKVSYGVDLPAELDRRIIGSVGSLLSFACQHKVLAEVQYVHRAVGRTPEELRELHEAYLAVHKSDMLEHVLSYCKDDITKAFFTEMVKDKEDKPLDKAEATIENLHRLLEARDLEGLLKYVAALTTAQLYTVVRSYNSTYKDAHVVTTIQKTIKHKGEHVDILLFAIMQASDPARHVSLLLEESMAGLGTNEDQLSRLVVMNRGKFMDKVKASYQVDYSRTLADRVRPPALPFDQPDNLKGSSGRELNTPKARNYRRI